MGNTVSAHIYEIKVFEQKQYFPLILNGDFVVHV